VAKIWPSSKKPVVETVTAVPMTASTGDIPSVESPEFGDWISVPANVDKLVASLGH
jgi:hypothetical protein